VGAKTTKPLRGDGTVLRSRFCRFRSKQTCQNAEKVSLVSERNGPLQFDPPSWSTGLHREAFLCNLPCTCRTGTPSSGAVLSRRARCIEGRCSPSRCGSDTRRSRGRTRCRGRCTRTCGTPRAAANKARVLAITFAGREVFIVGKQRFRQWREADQRVEGTAWYLTLLWEPISCEIRSDFWTLWTKVSGCPVYFTE